MPALEVMLRRLVNDAMRGEKNAMKLLLSFVDRYTDTTEAKIQLSELQAQDREILAQYLPKPESTQKADVDDPDDAN